jgi:amidase
VGYQANLPSASELAAQLEARRTTVVEIVECHLSAIDEIEPHVHAFARLDREGALTRARELDAHVGPRGVLYGLPVGFKDNIDSARLKTSYGSSIYADHQPERDAASVAAVRLADGIVLGKTVSAEFAHRAPGPTRNPCNTAHTPGGSSSGSAAAVGAGMLPIAFGSQTTGSVIRPAAFCGVVGYKPTYGEFSAAGMLANAPSFDTLGVMVRDVCDLTLVRRALLDPSIPLLDRHPVSGLRVGVCRSRHWPKAAPTTQSMLDGTVLALERCGAVVHDFDDRGAFDNIEADTSLVSGYEFARSLGHERRTAYAQLSAELRDGRMAEGLGTAYEDYAGALVRLRAARAIADVALDAVDVVISPAAPAGAPTGLESTGDPCFNLAWTTLHTPVITLPAGVDSQGLPLGLQIIARRHSDDRLIGVARAMHEVLTR